MVPFAWVPSLSRVVLYLPLTSPRKGFKKLIQSIRYFNYVVLPQRGYSTEYIPPSSSADSDELHDELHGGVDYHPINQHTHPPVSLSTYLRAMCIVSTCSYPSFRDSHITPYGYLKGGRGDDRKGVARLHVLGF